MSNRNSKSDRFKHEKVAKSEKQYVRGIVHNLSLSRWTDQEIVDYLRDEKKINIARSTVNSIKNQVEKQARKWYLVSGTSIHSVQIYRKLQIPIQCRNNFPSLNISSCSREHYLAVTNDILTKIDSERGLIPRSLYLRKILEQTYPGNKTIDREVNKNTRLVILKIKTKKNKD